MAAGTRPRPRLDRRTWAEQALAAISRGGLRAVSVEALAVQLGTTKGSFYHHFTDRQDLLGAALDLWEQTHTGAVHELVAGASEEPAEQLRLLARETVRTAERDPVGLRLLASADDPLVATVLERVTAARLDVLNRLFRRLGHRPADARRRALLAYSAYLGHAQLAHSTPSVLPPPGTAARTVYLDLVLDRLVGPAAPSDG
jgi:AcrR family transcriptional regulator